MVGDIRKRNAGSQMAAMMNHEPPRPLRNHQKGNVQNMRQLQDKVRETKLEDAQKKVDEENKWKMRQFKNVASRCREDPVRLRQEKEQRREEIAESSQLARERKMDEEMQARQDERRRQYDDEDDRYDDEGGDTHPDAFNRRVKPDVPGRGVASNYRAASDKPISRNFVNENRRAAQELDSRGPGKQFDDSKLKSFEKLKDGVPTYLTEIKSKLAEDKRKASEKIEEIPPGYRLMGEAEKQDTLSALRERQADAESKWRKLPLQIQTEGQKRRQTDIQNEIKECERMIGLFDKPRVLVEM